MVLNFITKKTKIIHTLLQHLGFLYALVIFKNKVENIDEFSTEHFENLLTGIKV